MLRRRPLRFAQILYCCCTLLFLCVTVTDSHDCFPQPCDPANHCPPFDTSPCRFGATLDSCACCTICAKGPGESCGGVWGQRGTCGNTTRCMVEVEWNTSYAEYIQTPGVCKGGKKEMCLSQSCHDVDQKQQKSIISHVALFLRLGGHEYNCMRPILLQIRNLLYQLPTQLQGLSYQLPTQLHGLLYQLPTQLHGLSVEHLVRRNSVLMARTDTVQPLSKTFKNLLARI